MTFKKTLHAAEQDRPDIKAARAAWREMQKTLDPKKLVFIDETWTSANMTPRRGRCESGKRLIAHAPFGHRKTATFLAALRHDGVSAPCVFDGPIDGERFLAYVEHMLVPALAPGEIVMMDNSPPAGGVRRAPLGSHKRAAVRKAIEAAGAALSLLPACSPGPDPVEQVFANSPQAFPTSCACWNLKPAPLKNRLRKMGCRTVDALWQAIATALDDFPPEQCANYIRNAGYGSA